MEKHYGIFKICYNSYKFSSADERNNEVLHLVFGNTWWTSEGTGHHRGTSVFDSKEEALRDIQGLRWLDRESRRNERFAYNKYVHRFFVHECDATGNYIASKAEIKKAVKYYIEKDLHWSEPIDAAVRRYAAENKITA